MNIKIKFIVASDAAVQILQDLAHTRLKEKFTTILSEKLLNEYLVLKYNTRSLTILLNDFSNKCLLAFVDEKPAGYAIFSAVSQNPPILTSIRVTHLIDLEVLEIFKESNAKQELLEKFLSQCQDNEAVWLQEIPEDGVVNFYTKNGFKKGKEIVNLDSLPIPAVYLIKEKNLI